MSLAAVGAAGGIQALRGALGVHWLWMSWNLFLALVPLALALVLFRPTARHTVAWWFGVVLFVLFLPNAAYVLTDVVHLFADIRRVPSDLRVLGAYVPLYLAFFAIGFGAYVVCLDRVRDHLRTVRPGMRTWPIELALQVLSAIGIYLGRVVRLNSWQVFTRPRSVVASVDWLLDVLPLAIVAVTAVGLIVLTFAARALGHAAAEAAHHLAGPGGPRRRGLAT